jgi:hypothetical protein
MKNSGIASLRILGSGRCGSLVAAVDRTSDITVVAASTFSVVVRLAGVAEVGNWPYLKAETWP